MDRYTSGIPGLDELLKGGILDYPSILLSGIPGAGKSIFSLQFLIEGAKRNQPGLFITPEMPAERVRQHARALGLDTEQYEKKGLIFFVEKEINDSKAPLKAPLDIIRKKKIKRVVLDSLTFFNYIFPEKRDFRKGLLSFLDEMKSKQIVFLATAERSTCDIDDFHFQIQDFLFDGLIILTKIRKGASFERTINIVKMRGQDHAENIFPFSIGKGGIRIRVKQLPFSLIEKSGK